MCTTGVTVTAMRGNEKIQYDTIRYGMYIYMRSKADEMSSLVKRTTQKQKIRKN